MCKVRKLPGNFKIRDDLDSYYRNKYDFNRAAYEEALKHCNDVFDDIGASNEHSHSADAVIKSKLRMLWIVRDMLKNECNVEFDELNGLPPTRFNLYRAYEYSAVWMWNEIAWFISHSEEGISDSWYNKYRGVLASVMKKYPKITGMLISIADLKLPGNKLLDYSKMENAKWDDDHTDEGLTDEKAESFKNWIMKWCNEATEKDKMRVRRWFETDKSHKQIFAEINKVVGNFYKFNARLALFVERLFNKQNLENFFSKSGFDSKEELFMAYFDKLTEFDEETKKAFINKYLV